MPHSLGLPPDYIEPPVARAHTAGSTVCGGHYTGDPESDLPCGPGASGFLVGTLPGYLAQALPSDGKTDPVACGASIGGTPSRCPQREVWPGVYPVPSRAKLGLRRETGGSMGAQSWCFWAGEEGA